MSTRAELLEQLYQCFWNDIATFESDNPMYSYIKYSDLIKLEEICTQIEEAEPPVTDLHRSFRNSGSRFDSGRGHRGGHTATVEPEHTVMRRCLAHGEQRQLVNPGKSRSLPAPAPN